MEIFDETPGLHRNSVNDCFSDSLNEAAKASGKTGRSYLPGRKFRSTNGRNRPMLVSGYAQLSTLRNPAR
jgi:hypothetical protein